MKLIVIDIETAGMTFNVAEPIVEIGAVLIDTTTWSIIPIMNRLINEGIPINKDAWIFRNSNLTYTEVVERGVSIEFMYNELQWWFDQCPTFAFNEKFDFTRLKSRGFKIRHIAPDPMIVLTHIMKLPLKGRIGYKYPSVVEAMKYCCIEGTEPHRGMFDAKIEAQIIISLIGKDIIKMSEIEYCMKSIANPLALSSIEAVDNVL